MFNSFPQPRPDAVGGSPNLQDWSAYKTVYDISGVGVSVPASTWHTFVDVTATGFFKWCRMDAPSGGSLYNPDIRVTIDGIPYVFDTSFGGQYANGNEINHEIHFKSSLKIEGYNRLTSAANISCEYLYLLQQSTPSKEITLLSQSQRKMVYLASNSASLADAVNVVGSGYLLSARFLGFHGAASVPGGVVADITVDGVNKVNSRTVYQLSAQAFKSTEFVGPIRFDQSLVIKALTNNASTYLLVFAWYSLD